MTHDSEKGRGDIWETITEDDMRTIVQFSIWICAGAKCSVRVTQFTDFHRVTAWRHLLYHSRGAIYQLTEPLLQRVQLIMARESRKHMGVWWARKINIACFCLHSRPACECVWATLKEYCVNHRQPSF